MLNFDPNDPMTNNIIHWLLVNTNRLQRVPAALVTAIIALFAACLWLVWDTANPGSALIAASLYAGTSGFNWLLLWLLPRFRRSFGPDKPSTLALAALQWLLLMPLALLGSPWWLALAVCAAISMIVFYSTWIEPFRLGVTVQRYATSRWSHAPQPLRLLHIGDLHMERPTLRERRLNQLIEEIQPDVIVFSGDFINISYSDDPITHQAIRDVISHWSAPLGVYCVPGTYTVEALDQVRQFTAGLDNLTLLLDRWISLETGGGPLHILGMVTTHRLYQDREKIARLMQTAPPGGLRLLLTHAPDVAPEADAAGYDLYLCGHTHGGQLRLPFIGAIFTGSHLGRRFVMGRYDLNNVTVYTSRGVGLEGMGAPRARFLCPPEIILWEISGQSPSDTG